jgi:2'-5' RNA ligase
VVERLKRLFLAVPLAEEVRATLVQHLGPGRLPGRPVSSSNWHLTVRFLGDTDQLMEEKLTAGLDQSDLGAGFDIALGEMGAFPRPARATVLWLAVDEGMDRLVELNEVCEEAAQVAGFPPEERPYSPHLTLSRIRPDQDVRPVIAQYQPAPLRWRATTLVLFRSLSSGGLHYDPIERFELD